MFSVSTAFPEQAERSEELGQEELQNNWVTVVWDDPVNLMSYVTYVFQSYFGYSREHAQHLMQTVHHTGKAVVAKGMRERMERDTQAMHSFGLWATCQQEGGIL